MGTPITIGTMSIQQLKDCVLWKPRVEPSAIIGTEFKAAFHSLYRQALSNDATDATEALDMAQICHLTALWRQLLEIALKTSCFIGTQTYLAIFF